MPRRQAPEVNAGSMADIAFLLLIFFLVTSQMSKEAGMFQLLPEKTDVPPVDINERNVISVLARSGGETRFGSSNKMAEMAEIPALLKEMVINVNNREDWPESRAITESELQERVNKNRADLEVAPIEKQRSFKKRLRKAELRLKALQVFGSDFRKSKHVINMQSTQEVDYETYIELKNALKKGYKLMRSELAQKKLGRGWEELSLEEKEMLKMVYKENISEAPVVKN